MVEVNVRLRDKVAPRRATREIQLGRYIVCQGLRDEVPPAPRLVNKLTREIHRMSNGTGPPDTTKKLAYWVDLLVLSRNHVFELFRSETLYMNKN